uniref:Uncharacterized protein n=1 Tax=Anopheles albimanus TaxID=7167 RepID=A0A182F5C2_ANOAL
FTFLLCELAGGYALCVVLSLRSDRTRWSTTATSSSSTSSDSCPIPGSAAAVLRQLPVPYAKPGVNGGTAIPLPATVLVTRRCPPDKVRPLPPTPNQQTGLHGGLQKHTLGGSGGGVTNGGTPSDGNSCPGSPQHNGTAIITQIPKGNNSLRLPQATNCKIPASPYASAASTLQHSNHHHHNNNNNNNITLIPNGNVTNIPTNPGQHQQQQKHSMLDKFKLFNSKEKQERSAQKSQISKRTSSSSGFSSARSERSDSSLSLDNGQHQQTSGSKAPKESGLKKLEPPSIKSSAAAASVGGKASSKLLTSSSSSSAAAKASAKESAKAAAKAEKQQRGSKDASDSAAQNAQTHIPLAPKAQKIPMATTVTTTSMAALAPKDSSGTSSSSSSRLKLATGGSVGRKVDTKSESKTSLLQHHQQQQQQATLVATAGSPAMMMSQSPHLQSPKTMQLQPQLQCPAVAPQQQPPAQPAAVNTGIPKPMAAIKGMSKPSHLMTPSVGLKEEPSAKVLGELGKPPGNHHNNNATGGVVLGGGGSNNNSPPQHQHQQQQQLSNGASSMSDSMHSNSTQGASMGQHSNSSETSSVVAYRPSSESGSEQLIHSNLQSPQKAPVASPLLHYPGGGQPDCNLNGNGTAGFLTGNTNNHINNNHNHNNNNNLSKFNTVPSKILNTAAAQVGLVSSPVTGAPCGNGTATIYEQDEKQITVLPMRPLLRGYNSHVTLPTRGTRGHHPHAHHQSPHHHQHPFLAAEYGDDYGGPGGAGSGYCSDGDALRKIPARYSDNIDNGYLSEGGTAVSTRQQHASYIGSLRARTQLPTTIEER